MTFVLVGAGLTAVTEVIVGGSDGGSRIPDVGVGLGIRGGGVGVGDHSGDGRFIMTGSDDFIRRHGTYTAADADCGGRTGSSGGGIGDILVSLLLSWGLVFLQCCDMLRLSIYFSRLCITIVVYI